MDLLSALTNFAWLDYAALAILLLGWIILTLVIERPPKSRPSVSLLMSEYRREWMRQFVERDPRIFDAQIISNLRQSTAFFASACMIAIGGGFALIGNADRLQGLAEDLTQADDPIVVWELKLILLLIFAANAFLKFVWSHRLFGYCAVIMSAVPNDPKDPQALPRAAKAAALNITAARGYNRGLRSVYFGIAAAAWLLGPLPLLAAAVLTILVIARREFASHSRAVLLETTDSMGRTQT